MKLSTILKTTTAMLLLIIFVTACEPARKQADSDEVAKETNNATFSSRDDEKDADFVVNTVAASYAEIKLAQLAIKRSNDSEVKKMASMLEADHKKMLKELQAYAGKKGISLPGKETDEAQKDINKLAEKDSKDFDEDWCDMLEDSHQKTINKFESRIDKTEDAELKNWISKTLPGLRNHHEMLKKHEDRVK